jgi:hypothetical protein
MTRYTPLTDGVDKAEWWTLENITVLQTPDGSHVGAPFQHVNAAMGHLKKFLPHSNAANYIELWPTCLVIITLFNTLITGRQPTCRLRLNADIHRDLS